MTKTFTNTIRNAGIALALVTSISALSSTASFAYSSEAQAQCTGDAFRLCSSEIPNIPKITACMFKNRSQLSRRLPLRDGPRPRSEDPQRRCAVSLLFGSDAAQENHLRRIAAFVPLPRTDKCVAARGSAA